MSTKVYKKRYTEENVWELAIERLKRVWEMADEMVVSFSGGKDSTVLLNAAIEVHRQMGETKPLKVVFWDEEAIPWPTIEYVYREALRERVELHWMCMPIKHRNACSAKHPYWWCWDETKEDLWCRPMPTKEEYPRAIIHNIHNTTGFERLTVPELNDWMTRTIGCTGSVGMLVGLRATESLRRYMIVARKSREALNFVSVDPKCSRVYMIKPIYDMTTEDIWTAHKLFKWDHNTSYDDQERAGISRHNSRVCPPFGEEPLGGLYKYQICYPDLAEKMLYRVEGVATAMRYARTALYSFGDSGFDPKVDPEQQIDHALLRWKPDIRELVKNRIQREIGNHNRKSGNAPIPLTKAGSTGISWSFLYMLAVRGDFKGRKNPRVAKPSATSTPS
jgi:predicted phosphoadenosine phosphosulfate sulfurtransferase